MLDIKAAATHRAFLLVVVVAVVALVCAGVAALGGGDDEATRAAETGGGESSEAADAGAGPSVELDLKAMPEEVPQKARPVSREDRPAVREAKRQVLDFVKLTTAFEGADVDGALAGMAAGPALSELQALAQQYDNEGIRVQGAPRVLGSRVVEVASPDDVTFGVCLDNSKVRVLDAQDNNLVADRSRSERIVLNLYQVQRLEGRWTVVNHSIPADSSCAGEAGGA